MNKEQILIASNFVANLIKGLSVEHRLPLTTVKPEHLNRMILANVPKHRIKQFIVDRFEEKTQEEKKCKEAGFSEETMRSFDELEVHALCK